MRKSARSKSFGLFRIYTLYKESKYEIELTMQTNFFLKLTFSCIFLFVKNNFSSEDKAGFMSKKEKLAADLASKTANVTF